MSNPTTAVRVAASALDLGGPREGGAAVGQLADHDEVRIGREGGRGQRANHLGRPERHGVPALPSQPPVVTDPATASATVTARPFGWYKSVYQSVTVCRKFLVWRETAALIG